jgi:hypothetical protein
MEATVRTDPFIQGFLVAEHRRDLLREAERARLRASVAHPGRGEGLVLSLLREARAEWRRAFRSPTKPAMHRAEDEGLYATSPLRQHQPG